MDMKIRLTKEQVEQLAKNPEARVDVADPWWVVALKVVAYLIGLILAGAGTTTAAAAMGLCCMQLPL